MSFLIDPVLLFLSGLAIYYLGRKMEWNRHAKIVAGLAVASIFIIFSTCYVTISSAAHSRSFLTLAAQDLCFIQT